MKSFKSVFECKNEFNIFIPVCNLQIIKHTNITKQSLNIILIMIKSERFGNNISNLCLHHAHNTLSRIYSCVAKWQHNSVIIFFMCVIKTKWKLYIFPPKFCRNEQSISRLIGVKSLGSYLECTGKFTWGWVLNNPARLRPVLRPS
jgi:hypothetical protein